MKSTNMPKYFIILYTGTDLWYSYIKWLNETYDVDWDGNVENHYYGYDGNSSFCGTDHFTSATKFKKSPEVITLEQWDQWVNKKEIYFEAY